MARDQGDFETAHRSYEAALAHETSLSQRGHILSNMGWLAYYRGDLEHGRALQEDSLRIRHQLGEPRSIAVSLSVLARIALARGDHVAARALNAESLPMHEAVGNQWGVALALEGIASLVAQVRQDRALRLASAAAVIRSSIGRPLPPAEQPLFERNLGAARRALSPAAQSAAWAAGAALSVPHAIAEAQLEVASIEPSEAELTSPR